MSCQIKDVHRRRAEREIRQAIKKMNKSGAMLRYITSDMTPSPRIVKTLMLPNVSKEELLERLGNNPTLAKVR
jgi:hypothetical protein